MLFTANDRNSCGSAPPGNQRTENALISELLVEAGRLEEVTVFEGRRLLKRAADEIWIVREELELWGVLRPEQSRDISAELKLMAANILTVPRQLLRLAFWEASLTLGELEKMRFEVVSAH